MRITLTLDTDPKPEPKKRKRPKQKKPKHHPEGDNFATVESAEYTKEPQVGFTRPGYWEEESGDKSRRGSRPAR